MSILRRVFLATGLVAVVLALWIAVDFANRSTHDLRQFDAHEVARLETAMWRSYYEHHRVRLFGELTVLLRRQFHLPFWRSCAAAWYAARAAVVFQAGHSHADYARALPDLDRYYSLIRSASVSRFDPHRAASLELDWWIVHRERADHTPADLSRSLAALQSEIYALPEDRFREHGDARAEAMLLRDTRAAEGALTEADWTRIGALLNRSWTSLRQALAN